MENNRPLPAKTGSTSRVRATRYTLDKQLIVSSKTLGTALTYDLTTQNISRTGMLLSWAHGLPIPFIETTILEMTIDPDGVWLEKPLSCLGKIVRKSVADETKSKDVAFGINIVQIDDTDLQQWENCVAELASRSVPIQYDLQFKSAVRR
jgi:hypothetical protein